MTLSNSQTATLHAAIAADKSLGAAAATFATRIASMAEAGWTVELMAENKPGIVAQVAERILNKTDLALFKDESKAQKVRGMDGRQLYTPRGKVVNRCAQSFERMKAAIAAPVSKGPKTPKSRPEVIADYLGKIAASVAKDYGAEASDLKGHAELMVALKRANDLLPVKVSALKFNLASK
jgi:hypothetical protein